MTWTSDIVIPFLCILGNHIALKDWNLLEGEWRYRRLVLKQPLHSKICVQQGGAGGEPKACERAGSALELLCEVLTPRDQEADGLRV